MAAVNKLINEKPLTHVWGHTALALRGYNQTNWGRTAELCTVTAFRPTIEKWLIRAGDVCRRSIGKPVNLVARLEKGDEPLLADYSEAVAVVMGVEMAQLELLEQHFGFTVGDARLAFGYSLGEVIAVAAAGLMDFDEAMSVPLALAADCATLADDCTMAIVFSRREKIAEDELALMCLDITSQGIGTIAISAVLSPNSYLVIGQGKSVDQLESLARTRLGKRVSVRRNPDKWPPLHTPIVRQCGVPDRAAALMETMKLVHDRPHPPVFSLTSGQANYGPLTAREILRDWADHPQRLWDAVRFVLGSNIQTIVHVGPAPNVIPATFARVAENVAQQLGQSSWQGYGTWAMAGLAARRWLTNLLPRDTALLRAPLLKQVILEDWLLENAPKPGETKPFEASLDSPNGYEDLK